MFTLITLPYAAEGLEPVISRETIEFHHGKHLQALWEIINWEEIERQYLAQ